MFERRQDVMTIKKKLEALRNIDFSKIEALKELEADKLDKLHTVLSEIQLPSVDLSRLKDKREQAITVIHDISPETKKKILLFGGISVIAASIIGGCVAYCLFKKEKDKEKEELDELDELNELDELMFN